jgi:hypothetical protein
MSEERKKKSEKNPRALVGLLPSACLSYQPFG